MIAPFIAQVSFPLWPSRPGVPLPHLPACVLQVLMSQSVIQALTPFAVASFICALGTFLLPIETKGRALLVRNLLQLLLKSPSVELEDCSFHFSKTPDDGSRTFAHLVGPTSAAHLSHPVGTSHCGSLEMMLETSQKC